MLALLLVMLALLPCPAPPPGSPRPGRKVSSSGEAGGFVRHTSEDVIVGTTLNQGHRLRSPDPLGRGLWRPGPFRVTSVPSPSSPPPSPSLLGTSCPWVEEVGLFGGRSLGGPAARGWAWGCPGSGPTLVAVLGPAVPALPPGAPLRLQYLFSLTFCPASFIVSHGREGLHPPPACHRSKTVNDCLLVIY